MSGTVIITAGSVAHHRILDFCLVNALLRFVFKLPYETSRGSCSDIDDCISKRSLYPRESDELTDIILRSD